MSIFRVAARFAVKLAAGLPEGMSLEEQMNMVSNRLRQDPDNPELKQRYLDLEKEWQRVIEEVMGDPAPAKARTIPKPKAPPKPKEAPKPEQPKRRRRIVPPAGAGVSETIEPKPIEPKPKPKRKAKSKPAPEPEIEQAPESEDPPTLKEPIIQRWLGMPSTDPGPRLSLEQERTGTPPPRGVVEWKDRVEMTDEEEAELWREVQEGWKATEADINRNKAVTVFVMNEIGTDKEVGPDVVRLTIDGEDAGYWVFDKEGGYYKKGAEISLDIPSKRLTEVTRSISKSKPDFSWRSSEEE